MREVVILALGGGDGGCGDRAGGGACGCGDQPRVPVLACADGLRAGGATVRTVTAGDDAELDAALTPVASGDADLVVAAASDGELRAVVRRLTRRFSPPPSKRPSDLPAGRTMFDLPALALLPLSPGRPDLIGALDLPATPAEVAAAVVAGRTRRLDLLRVDGGSVTLHGCLVGTGAADAPMAWRGRVEVDDSVLTDGDEPVVACSIRNVGSSHVDGLPLVAAAAPDDGLIEVAVAVPRLRRRLIRPAAVDVEVRRARGRAVSVTPRDPEVPFVDDGVAGVLTHKRAWWIEHDAWALYVR